MNRREFLLRSSLLASAGVLARSSLLAQSPAASSTVPVKTPAGPMQPVVTKFRPLRRGVGLFAGHGGTIGWLSDQDALAVVDTQDPDTAAVCLAGLPGRGDRTLDVVLNTHHPADHTGGHGIFQPAPRTLDVVLNTPPHAAHTGGNGIFKPATRTMVAQANVPQLMLAAAQKAGTVDKQTYPDTTFTAAT